MRITITFYLLIILFVWQIEFFAQTNETKSNSNIVYLKGGCKKLGSTKGETDEKPSRWIKINSFYLGKFEVTNKEFVDFLNEKGNQNEGNTPWINLDGNWNELKCRIYFHDGKYVVEKGFEDFPVNYVNWFAADAYCRWKGGRLPTEAEWEFALKKGSVKRKYKQINMDDYAWYKLNSESNLHKCGEKKPDKQGIYDMYGNLWEWCADYYQANYYKSRVKKNPIGPKSGDFKVIRGGSWTNDLEMLRSTNRNAISPNSNKINVGFRIAFNAKN